MSLTCRVAFWASASLFALAASVMKPFWKMYCFRMEASTICSSHWATCQLSVHPVLCYSISALPAGQPGHDRPHFRNSNLPGLVLIYGCEAGMMENSRSIMSGSQHHT